MIIDDQQSPKMRKIALIGEAMIEVSALDFAKSSARIGIAGDTLNTAIYLSRATTDAGWHCDYLTVLGQDQLSDHMINFIASEGIGTDVIGRNPESVPAVYAINVDDAGERSFTYWRNQSAARLLFQGGTPSLEALAGYQVIYLSAITLAILPAKTRAALISRCKSLKELGHVIAFDSNYRPSLWASADEARATIDAMWGATSLALPSHDDEVLLYPTETAHQTLQRIVALGVEEVALKRGPSGPLLWSAGSTLENAFAAADKVVDTTAAGDSFNAGYLAARLRGAEPAEAAQSGHALACQVIGVKGAILPKP